MHLSMHNWMQAEPIEVTILGSTNMATRASRSAASREFLRNEAMLKGSSTDAAFAAGVQ